MLLTSLKVSKNEFEKGTGWQLKPEGACKGDVCIPIPNSGNDTVDIKATAEAMNLPLVEAADAKLWALGPASIAGKALVTAEAPELSLPDVDGKVFNLSSLKGRKVLVYAWAPY
ncbi:MAG TPA: hypothetical protein EYQ22_11185 [Gammaproteobacteria bacterium]|nr:hypothetical protein [Gammaproteobacteria bacterium]HIK68646.1 hypothetical protein [Pseudomonadales bacterium]